MYTNKNSICLASVIPSHQSSPNKNQQNAQNPQFHLNERMLNIKNLFLQAAPDPCNQAIIQLTRLIKQGFSCKVSQNQCLLKSIIKYFNRLSDELQGYSQNKTDLLENKMVCILSLLSQILYENKDCRLPLNSQFISNIFLINPDLINQSQKRKEISRICSVLLQYLSRQSPVLIECGMFSRFRHILLSSFKLASDYNTLQRLLRALCNTTYLYPLDINDLIGNGVIQAIQKFMRENDINRMLRCLNLQKLLSDGRLKAKMNI